MVPKCEDPQASGALLLLLHPCFFPVMSLGLGTPCPFQELAPCPCAAPPSASSSRDTCWPGMTWTQVPGCPLLPLSP